ncbi:ABC transporter permease [Sporolactobacillus terrae]|uniref:ABC transporter permease n=1 Tax=Sporolactobacillus terrae TaxID=269673 RepID=A0A5K7WW56_9BACL|nr:ABC transporter permease [Sporolactobacillus terrae]BBN97874.1 ABC transporter permease [Sporolactobacillus terrae]
MKKSPTKARLFLIRTDIPRKWYWIGTILSFVFVLLVWQVMSSFHIVQTTFLPSPEFVFNTFIQLITSTDYWADIGISFYRVFMGFLLAAIIGVPLGILAGTFKITESLIIPLSEFIRYMPAPAFIPLIMVWAGIGETAKILIIFIGSFFQLIIMVADDTKAVNEDLIHASYTLGANRRMALIRVILPAVLPRLFSTLRLIMGWAWTYLVVAELVAADSGLGYSIMKAQRFMNTDVIFVGILVIGLLGLIIDRLFVVLNRVLFPWSEGGK